MEEKMPTEWSHAAVRGLLTQHHWSVTKAKVVERGGEVRNKGENTQIRDEERIRWRRLAAASSTNLCIYRRWTQHHEPQ